MMHIKMNLQRNLGAAFTFVLLAAAINTPVQAAGDSVKLEKQDWSFSGIFGTYDRGAIKRGYQIYSEVCGSCHSLNYMAYRNLMEVGFEEGTVKEIAAEFEVEDGPDDEGEMFMRPARPSDRFVAPYANKKASRAANNGAYPPDLSLMVKARKGGPDYLFGLLTGYREEAPEGMELAAGMNYNEVYPGHQIAMSQPLYDESVEYDDGTPATLIQHAKDITTFLAWTASPEMEHRKRLGIKVMLFLLVWTAMLIALKKRIWANLQKKKPQV
jgi:ubiquinol-cytochrome c reductase cytochrome c1 subunit